MLRQIFGVEDDCERSTRETVREISQSGGAIGVQSPDWSTRVPPCAKIISESGDTWAESQEARVLTPTQSYSIRVHLVCCGFTRRWFFLHFTLSIIIYLILRASSPCIECMVHFSTSFCLSPPLPKSLTLFLSSSPPASISLSSHHTSDLIPFGPCFIPSLSLPPNYGSLCSEVVGELND